jgi:hypothetical protein
VENSTPSVLASTKSGQVHYRDLAELQTDLDCWLMDYNEVRPHQGRWCFGKTPMQTFIDSLPLAHEKLLGQAV